MSKRGKNAALGTLFMAAVGYVVGILTAPKSGKETRRDIQQQAVKAKSEAEKTLKSVHSELNELLLKIKKQAISANKTTHKGLEEAMKKATNAREKARSILSAVHEGDATDKDLQKAINEVNDAIEHLKKYIQKDEKKAK